MIASPTPDEQALFWSRIAERYDDIVDRQLGRGTRALLRERLAALGPLGRAAEFGCGTGYFTQVLAGRADELLASDVSPGMLDVARARVAAGRVRFEVQDCQRTTLPDGALDTAVLALVLHFTEPERTLRELHRVLRVGGTLVLANLDPLALGALDRLRALVRVLAAGVAGYRARPPRRFGRAVLGAARLVALLDATGFDVVSLETVRDGSRSSNVPVDLVRARKR